jgi:uncharacterized LabA/DUF88 family protein
MDILYSEKTDGFVIVSSDSDFTRLAIRLREAGQRVIGIGERKTPNAFISACDKFIYIEVIHANAEEAREEARADNEESDSKPVVQRRDRSHYSSRPRGMKVPDDIITLIADSIADLGGDDGIVFMGELGNLILKKQPDFDHRSFGYMSLSAMCKSIERFEIEFRQTTDPNIKHVFVRDREAT